MTSHIDAVERPDVSRRRFLSSTALAGAAIAVGARALKAEAEIANPPIGRRGGTVPPPLRTELSRHEVMFDNAGIVMAGLLFLPAQHDPRAKYSAVVVVHPGGGVKEQTAGLFAEKLAARGFVALSFDASHQGASGGLPRFLDDPIRRVGDIYSAVDYLTTLPYVAADRIGALGICAGSGATVKAATTERRIRAIATVSAVDVGAAARHGWDGTGNESDVLQTLDAVAVQRTAEAAGAAPVYVPYVPAVGDTSAPRDLQEAADYYLTPRGQHPNAPNKMLLTSVSSLVSFTGFDRIETLLTQPLLVVAGSAAGSLWHSRQLHAKAAGPKELVILDGATHMDLYDGVGAETALRHLAPFFARTLGAAR